MAQVLLVILKIAGILLLVLVGLALAAMLCLLFVPVRYRIAGDYKGQFQGDIRASWLLFVLTFCVTCRQDVTEGKLKVFGLTVWPRAQKRAHGPDLLDGKEEWVLKEEPEGKTEEQTAIPSAVPLEGERETAEKEKAPGKPRKKKTRHFAPTGIYQRFLTLIQKIRFAFRGFYDKLKHIKEHAEEILDWIQDEGNRRNIHFLFGCLKEILGHIFPKKGCIRLTFGFEDPALTGQVLALASPFYPLYGRVAVLTPVFDHSVLEGEGDVRGRIRLFVLLKIGIKIWRNRELRNMIRKLRQA